MTLAWDPRKRTSSAIGDIRGIPHSLIFDQRGAVYSRHSGYSECIIDSMLRDINDLLYDRQASRSPCKEENVFSEEYKTDAEAQDSDDSALL